MKNYFLIALYIVVTISPAVLGDGENEIKRGVYPFMAFLYYPDETVIDLAGLRFMRSAVLIRLDWLVTSAIGPSIISNESEDFPRKTLIARVGAVAIDSKFTLNEDEDEQEREIVQIVRPFNHSATQWWRTDITLMKTLYPFNMTSAVNAITLYNKAEYVEKTCSVLVYASKSANKSDDIVLMQLSVELLPPSLENCGRHFVEDTMTCATDSDETKNAVYDSEYCRSNSGGPLICEGDVIGLQTYIDNNCRQPHLYQLLSAWENFISCGIEEKCHEEQCSSICIASKKDEDVSVLEDIFTTTLNTEGRKKNLEDARINSTVTIASTAVTLEEITKEYLEVTPTPTVNNETTVTDAIITDTLHTLKTSTYSKSWPRKVNENIKLQDANEKEDRKPNVEARQQDVKHVYNEAQRNLYNIRILLIKIIVFTYLI
ncbi:hypothetical protein K1T71_005145 [Dendrolimus kikuchii]|uniref:Uncharacterized protein n=1 Tax=Dendrolimus kikuchii TaxID=765133 RepID=A0ACC1D6A8_9NEOP|nr:hypothetical protein K1T71_005145 [Dendrolimus kikuchii]